MPEFAFIEAVSAYLAGPANLTPSPVQVGPVEPIEAAETPALVISLPAVRRLRGGLGEGAEPMTGVLPWTVQIDLANAVLPDEPGFSLLSPDRRILTLPHGGLIRADGLDGALGPADLQVTVAGVPRQLVGTDPGDDEFSVEPLAGRLSFGAALPATGTVEASYHLGAWERRVALIAGDLAVTARSATGADAAALCAAAARALARAGAVPGLKRLSLVSIGPVAPGNAAHADTRAQTAGYAFEYEHVVDAPASSGGIIHAIPLTTRLRLLRLDPASGAEVEETVTETR